MISIYQEERRLYDTFSQIQENDGELTKELDLLLSVNRELLNSKIEQISKMVKIANAELAIIETERERLAKIETKIENFLATIDKTIKTTVEKFGVEVATSKAKKKPLHIPFNLGEVSVTYTEAVLTPDKYEEELNNFITYDVKLPDLTNDEVEELQITYPNLKTVLKYNKKNIKEAIEAGKKYENADIITNSKLKWK